MKNNSTLPLVSEIKFTLHHPLPFGPKKFYLPKFSLPPHPASIIWLLPYGLQI